MTLRPRLAAALLAVCCTAGSAAEDAASKASFGDQVEGVMYGEGLLATLSFYLAKAPEIMGPLIVVGAIGGSVKHPPEDVTQALPVLALGSLGAYNAVESRDHERSDTEAFRWNMYALHAFAGLALFSGEPRATAEPSLIVRPVERGLMLTFQGSF